MSIIKQTEVHVVPTGHSSSKQVVFHNTWAGNSIASLATELIKHSMVYPSPKPPADMVDDCIAIAELTYNKFEEKGWLVPLPSWEELNEERSPAGFGA